MTDVIVGRYLESHRHTQGRKQCDIRDRDWNYKLKNGNDYLELPNSKKKQGKILYRAFTGSMPCQDLDFRQWDSGTMQEYSSTTLSHQFALIFYSSPRKLMYHQVLFHTPMYSKLFKCSIWSSFAQPVTCLMPKLFILGE